MSETVFRDYNFLVLKITKDLRKQNKIYSLYYLGTE
jgi:hypothetical protein